MQESSYLGTERPGKLLLKFAVPCIFSLIISCLYNIVDQIFVGNGVGYLGNAATGVIFPITVIGWGVSLFFGDGAAASRSISGHMWGDPHQYELSIDSSIGPEKTAELICAYINRM